MNNQAFWAQNGMLEDLRNYRFSSYFTPSSDLAGEEITSDNGFMVIELFVYKHRNHIDRENDDWQPHKWKLNCAWCTGCLNTIRYIIKRFHNPVIDSISDHGKEYWASTSTSNTGNAPADKQCCNITPITIINNWSRLAAARLKIVVPHSFNRLTKMRLSYV